MRHYSLEKWVDFARNVIAEDEKVGMQSHLETGCTACSKELSMWQRLQQVARREPAYTPSEGAVRTVNATFVNRSAGRSSRAKTQLASLLFDSFRGPLLAGVRSSGSASQQLLYGLGDYRIDVRVEPQMDSEKVVLVGQVLNSADPDERLSAMPVSLLKGKKILAESVTTEYGEFQIECELQSGIRLVVALSDRQEVSLQLVEPLFSSAEEAPHIANDNKVRKTSRIKKKGTRTKD
ncbi:MAG: hypothetical protein WCF88_04995 [Candidatus Acidiferrales bacterium]